MNWLNNNENKEKFIMLANDYNSIFLKGVSLSSLFVY